MTGTGIQKTGIGNFFNPGNPGILKNCIYFAIILSKNFIFLSQINFYFSLIIIYMYICIYYISQTDHTLPTGAGRQKCNIKVLLLCLPGLTGITGTGTRNPGPGPGISGTGIGNPGFDQDRDRDRD